MNPNATRKDSTTTKSPNDTTVAPGATLTSPTSNTDLITTNSATIIESLEPDPPKWIKDLKKSFVKFFHLSNNEKGERQELVDKFLLLEKAFGYKVRTSIQRVRVLLIDDFAILAGWQRPHRGQATICIAMARR